MSYTVKCFECGKTVTDDHADACPHCGGLLNVEMDLERLSDLTPADLRKRPMGVRTASTTTTSRMATLRERGPA